MIDSTIAVSSTGMTQRQRHVAEAAATCCAPSIADAS